MTNTSQRIFYQDHVSHSVSRTELSVRSARPLRSAVRRGTLFVVFVVSVALQSAHAFQEPTVSQPETESPRQPASTSKSSRIDKSGFDVDVIYLPRKDGELVPVPFNSKYEEYLEWLQKTDELPNDMPYKISSVVITGKTIRAAQGKEFASVDVDVRLSVYTESWTQIPLALGELIVSGNASHEGPGEFIFDRRDPLRGMIWWGKGKGKHQLRLSGFIPLRREVTTRRLALRVPRTLVNELTLAVPDPNIELVSATAEGISSLTKSGGTSVIALKGDVDRVDVSWRSVPDSKSKRNLFESTSVFVVSESNGAFKIEVEQLLSSLQGAIRSAEVRLPTNFELIDIQGNGLASYRFRNANSDIVELLFDQPITERINLSWRFAASAESMKMGENGTPELTIDGLDVLQTDLETGEILISQIDRKQLLAVDPDPRTLIKSRTDGRAIPGVYASAFRFLKQPFELKLSVVDVRPEATLQPEHLLIVFQDHLELRSRLRLKVLRGAVDRLQIQWPTTAPVRWEVDPFIDGADDASWQQLDETNYEIQFERPVTGTRDLMIKALLPVENKNASRDIQLPKVVGLTESTTQIGIGDARNIRSRIEWGDRAVAIVEMQDGLNLFDWFADRDTYRLQFFETRSDGNVVGLQLKTKVYSQEVDASRSISTEVVGDSLVVTQKIALNVRREPLTELQLESPGRSAVQFWFEEDAVTQLMATSYEMNGRRRAVLTFSPGILDERTIVASYRVPISVATSSTNVPLVSIIGLPFEQTAYLLSSTSPEIAVPTELGNAWSSRISADGQQEFRTAKPLDSMSVEIRENTLGTNMRLVDDRIAVVTDCRAASRSQSVIHATVVNNVNQIVIELPDQAKPVDVIADKSIVLPWKLVDESKLVFSVDLGDLRAPFDLAIRYEQPVGTTSFWGRTIEFQPPKIREAGDAECLWVVRLPKGEHLAFSDGRLVPQYQWKPTWVGWRREFRSPAAILEENRGTVNDGNQYGFLNSGADAARFRVASVRQSALLLFGGGIGLVIGLLFLSGVRMLGPIWPGLVLLACGLSSVLFRDSTLIVQPILLGIVLSMLAFAINSRSKRRRRRWNPSTLTATQPNEPRDSSHSVWANSDVVDVAHSESTQSHVPSLAGSSIDPGRSHDSGDVGV